MSWHARRTAFVAMATDDATAVRRRRPGRPPAFASNDFETLLPSQYPAGPGSTLQPAKRLMLAVLRDAIKLVLSPPHRMHRRLAMDWIRSDDRGELFSFVNVCETLGFEPRRLRAQLGRLVEQRGRARTTDPSG